jgi:hypothetical protein
MTSISKIEYASFISGMSSYQSHGKIKKTTTDKSTNRDSNGDFFSAEILKPPLSFSYFFVLYNNYSIN